MQQLVPIQKIISLCGRKDVKREGADKRYRHSARARLLPRVMRADNNAIRAAGADGQSATRKAGLRIDNRQQRMPRSSLLFLCDLGGH